MCGSKRPVPRRVPSTRAIDPFYLALDAALYRLATGSGMLDLALGEAFRRLDLSGKLIELGYAKTADYAVERHGVPASTMHSWIQLAREVKDRPVLSRAVRCGMVSPRKAIVVSRVAKDDLEEAWTAAAASVTEKELRRKVKASGGEIPLEWNYDSVMLRMSPEQQDRLDRAVDLCREVLGPDRSHWVHVEAVAMEYLSGYADHFEPPPEEHGLAVDDPEAFEGWISAWRARSKEVLAQLEALDKATVVLDHTPDEVLDFLQVHRQIASLLAARENFDMPLGWQAHVVQKLEVWKMLGFRSFAEYCRERLGLGERTVTSRIELEQKMNEYPEIREALRDGRLTYSKALKVARHACAEDVAARIERAAATTAQVVAREAEEEERARNRRRGVRCIWALEDALVTIRLGIACAKAVARAEGRIISDGEALALMADHFVSVWSEDVARKLEAIGPSRLAVLRRTRGLCAVPGCTRPAQHEHHIVYRSPGGSESPGNRIGVCDRHHLLGIHQGWITVEGIAGERLLWSLGIEDGVVREHWIVEGDDEARRA